MLVAARVARRSSRLPRCSQRSSQGVGGTYSWLVLSLALTLAIDLRCIRSCFSFYAFAFVHFQILNCLFFCFVFKCVWAVRSVMVPTVGRSIPTGASTDQATGQRVRHTTDGTTGHGRGPRPTSGTQFALPIFFGILVLAFWHFGILALWHFGIVALWHFGIMANFGIWSSLACCLPRSGFLSRLRD